MSKKVGDTNFFQKGKDYTVRDALGYLEKKGIEPRRSWYVGGNLNDWAKKIGLKPIRKSPNGGRSYYDYKQMYILVHTLEDHLKKRRAKSIGQQTPLRVSKTNKNIVILPQKETVDTFAEMITIRDPEQITIEDVINATNTTNEAFKALFNSVSECCDTLNEVKRILGGYYGRL